MKILFENTTKYTKSIYDNFLRFHRKKYHFTYMSYTILVIAFILLCLVIQVKAHHLTLAVLVCCGLTFFAFWRIFRPISKVTKEYNGDTIKKEKLFTFKFYDKMFTIEDDTHFSKIKYYQLYRVFETETFFYLYIDKTHSFLVNKSCFREDNWQSFSKFMKKKCWWIYKLVKTHKN